MTSSWKPEKYKDEFSEAVHKWAVNKVKHKSIPRMIRRGHPAASMDKKVNFIDLLKESLNENKKHSRVFKKHAAISHAKKKPHVVKRTSIH